jgi:hypothetical protein
MSIEPVGSLTGKKMLKSAEEFMQKLIDKHGDNIPENLLKAHSDLVQKGEEQLIKCLGELPKEIVQPQAPKEVVQNINTIKRELNKNVKYILKPFFKSKKRLARLSQDNTGIWWANEARDLRDLGNWYMLGDKDKLIEYKNESEQITGMKLKFVEVNKFGFETTAEIL